MAGVFIQTSYRVSGLNCSPVIVHVYDSSETMKYKEDVSRVFLYIYYNENLDLLEVSNGKFFVLQKEKKCHFFNGDSLICTEMDTHAEKRYFQPQDISSLFLLTLP